MSTGENIRALRDLHGITQEQLATKLGVTRESVVKWESGKINIRDRHVSKIVELFGVDPDDIKSDAYGLAAKEHGIVPKLPPNAIIPSQPRKAYAPSSDASTPGTRRSRTSSRTTSRCHTRCGTRTATGTSCKSRAAA